MVYDLGSLVNSKRMQAWAPSRTARAAAFHRAAHQVLERGSIFTDPLALAILGEDAETVARRAEEHPSGRRMRIFIAARTRFAEDALAVAVERGASQLVVLGAGLDTYAYRGALRERLRIFEIDHPATQAWKRDSLARAGIPVPPALTFAPIDFERQTLAEGLAAANFDLALQTFFTWLGCVPYLTKEAVWSTPQFVAGLAQWRARCVRLRRSSSVFITGGACESRSAGRACGELGEAWLNYFEADKLRAKLLGLGFREIEDLGPPQIASHYFPSRASSAPQRGGHILRAATL